ncbi:MAG: pyridoxine 5'-phosphate synthase, partial [Planctomycetes bacterium]|nr:pyridoxine 5'-phosphate synthase [Planctomycetota bacterium]
AGQRERMAGCIRRLQDAGIEVSLFLDPDPRQIEAARALGADAVELHTGQYALASSADDQEQELALLATAAGMVLDYGLTLHAGHGLNYRNVRPIAKLHGMSELNIGHSIVSRAVMVGMEQAVREMKRLIE